MFVRAAHSMCLRLYYVDRRSFAMVEILSLLFQNNCRLIPSNQE